MYVTVMWRVLLGACELRHIFVCKEKTAIITLKISGATARNLVTRATRDRGYVQRCITNNEFCKFIEETDRSFNLGSNPVFTWSECGRAQKTSVRTTVVPADILNHTTSTDILSLESSCSVDTLYSIDR